MTQEEAEPGHGCVLAHQVQFQALCYQEKESKHWLHLAGVGVGVGRVEGEWREGESGQGEGGSMDLGRGVGLVSSM